MSESRDSQPASTGHADKALHTDVEQHQGDTENVEFTPGARSAQSERSKEHASLAVSVEEVEDKGSDDDDGNSDEEEAHQKPARVASNPAPIPSEAIKEKNFGLTKDKTSGKKKEEELNDPLSSTFDYTKKYPPDKRYEELHNDARVWRTYNDEAAIFDTEMVGEAADSLDILLVFAGLFSAVLTTFVAQTSQSLSTDNTAVTVSLLVELVSVQRVGFAGGPISDIASANLSPSIDQTSIWVNALWFTSLALSLSSALLAVLSKQWLRQYVSFIKGSARERALIRQFRYDGMEKYAVRTIIGLLPTLLHLALALFLIGLVVFLAPLQLGIAISVAIISGALFAAYISSIIIAVVRIQSPYRTTFSDILSTALRWMFNTVYPFFQARLKLPEVSLMPTARDAEKASAVCLEEHRGATQACNALLWLHSTTGSMSAKTLIMQSLGAFPAEFFDGNTQQEVFVQLSNGCGPGYLGAINWTDNFPRSTAHDFEQILRILCHSEHGAHIYINTDKVEDHLKSDTGLTVACAGSGAMPPFQTEQNASEEGRSAKLTALEALFSEPASKILSLLPLDYGYLPNVSHVSIVESLGSAPPVVWRILVRKGLWFNQLSPRDLDYWPSDKVDLHEYLDLIDIARHNQPVQSPSVFQDPVDFVAILFPIFKSLGWYCWDSWDDSWQLHPSLMPLRLNPCWQYIDDGDLMIDSPPPDEDAVWEPAVYPLEWPPLPAPTSAQAWEAAEIMWKSQEAERAAWREAREKAWDAMFEERGTVEWVEGLQMKVLEFGDEVGEARDEAEEALKRADEALGKAMEEKEKADEARDSAEEALLKAGKALLKAGAAQDTPGEVEREAAEGGFGRSARKLAHKMFRRGERDESENIV